MATPIEMLKEEDPSLLRKAADVVLPGLAVAGNALDLPASVIRDLMTWAPGGIAAQNPIDQLLSPFSSKNRTTGRELLRSGGLIGKEDNWKNFLGGLGLEVAADPLTYATFGAWGALKATGKLLKGAGFLDEVAKVAAKKAGVRAGEVGMREAMLTTSLRDMITASEKGYARKGIRESLERVAEKQGININDVMDEAMGGLVGYGPPFMSPKGVLGTGAKSKAVAKWLDKYSINPLSPGRKIVDWKVPGLGFAPVATFQRNFNAVIKNASIPLGRVMGSALFHSQAGEQAIVRGFINKQMKNIERGGMAGSEHAQALRKIVETPADKLPTDLNPYIRQYHTAVHKELPEIVAEWNLLGLHGNTLMDSVVEAGRGMYHPRRLNAEFIKFYKGDKQKLYDLFDESAQIGRKEVFKDIEGMTDTINRIGADTEINDLIDSGATHREIADTIKGKFVDADGFSLVPDENLYPELGDGFIETIAKVPREIREKGIFGNHPLYDLQTSLLSARDRAAAARTIYQALDSAEVIGAKGIPLKAFLTEAGFDPAIALDRVSVLDDIGKKFGKDPSVIENLHVDADVAKDMLEFMKFYDGPENMHGVMQFVDNYTNLTKGMFTTPWPNFHVRNFNSATLQNAMAGIFNPRSYMDAYRFITGGLLEDLQSIPIIKHMSRERGYGPPVFGAERNRVRAMFRTTIGEQEGDYATLMAEARAHEWADATGRPADEFFKTIQDVKQSTPADVGQGAFWQGENVTATPAFKKWAGDAAFVSKDQSGPGGFDYQTGKPVVVEAYHGTAGGFEEFAPERMGRSTGAKSARKATFATSDPDVAESYSKLASEGKLGRSSKFFGVSIPPGEIEMLEDVQRTLKRQLYDYNVLKEGKLPYGHWGTNAGALDKTEVGRAIRQVGDHFNLFDDIIGHHEHSVGNLAYAFQSDARMRELGLSVEDGVNEHFLTHMRILGTQYKKLADRLDADLIQKLKGEGFSEKYELAAKRLKEADAELAHAKANAYESVMPIYVRMKNPLVVDHDYEERVFNRMIDQAKKDGHDGVIFTNSLDDPLRPEAKSTVFAVIDDKGIKSTFNRGTFGDTVNILEQGGQGKGARGAVEFAADGKAVIHAFAGADISTMAHELGHVFRRTLSPELMARAESAIGVKTGAAWTVANEEAFASGFERYLRDGEAPTKELRSVFEKFKEWLVNIYKSIKGTPLEKNVSPELKAVFDDMLGKQVVKKELTDQVATELLGELVTAYKIASKYEGETFNVAGDVAGAGSFEDMLAETFGPGLKRGLDVKRTAKKFVGAEPGTTRNPLKAEYRGVNQATESTFGPLAAGGDIGHFIETIVRIGPFLKQIRDGVEPLAAAMRVGEVQVQYANKFYTPFERQWMARLFPFYKFSKGMIPYTGRHLFERPGGAMAQTIRGANTLRDPDAVTPDYVAETAAIPTAGSPLELLVGKPKDAGTDRYLTGFGMAFEDPLAFAGGLQAGPGAFIRSAGLELASRSNPLGKGLAEWLTGQTFFQKGPRGGRDIADLDPTIGRLISNVQHIATGKKVRKAKGIPGPLMEHIIANSPLSRATTTLRTLTDQRKGPVAIGVNLLTGFRLSDVSEASSDAVFRERVQELMHEMGAKEFINTYFPVADREQFPEAKRERAELLQRVMRGLSAAAKARKEAMAEAE